MKQVMASMGDGRESTSESCEGRRTHTFRPAATLLTRCEIAWSAEARLFARAGSIVMSSVLLSVWVVSLWFVLMFARAMIDVMGLRLGLTWGVLA